ncbi:nuclear transport factor 2 family protein [Georgenia sp. AZ-5]|uniref:nuclear transport factor 2 family protein n=1 Tax=Georgenia sp. AZ-5 TaxID=3367526 RepID=UPI003754BF8E
MTDTATPSAPRTTADEVSRGMTDLEQIKRLKSRYFRYVDTKQWDEFRSLFTDDAEVDTSEAIVDPHGFWDGGRLPVVTPDAMTTALKARMTGVFTCHHGHDPEITFHSEDRASGVWAMEDIVRRPAGSELASFHGWGYYHEEYRKVDGEWRFTRVRVARLHVKQIDHFPAKD